MAKHDTGNYDFPDQAAPDSVKKTKEYGNRVANFIADEWFYFCLLYTSPSPRDS